MGTQLPPEKGAQQPPLSKWSPISATAELLCKVTADGVFDHATYHSCQKRAKTLLHLGQDSSALTSELSLGHFGTSADLSRQFRPTKLVPKCPAFELSWVQSIRNSRWHTVLLQCPLVDTLDALYRGTQLN